MERDHLADRSLEIGKKVMARYNEWKDKYEVVGIEFVEDKASKKPAKALTGAIINECAQNGLLVEGAGIYGNVIRFLAPLVMTDDQLEAGLNIFERAIKKCAKC